MEENTSHEWVFFSFDSLKQPWVWRNEGSYRGFTNPALTYMSVCALHYRVSKTVGHDLWRNKKQQLLAEEEKLAIHNHKASVQLPEEAEFSTTSGSRSKRPEAESSDKR
jgi:hypothetical protein